MDASSIVIKNGIFIAENTSWLWPVLKDRHINLVELYVVLTGVNLVLQGKASVIHLQTDLACVHCWIFDTFSGKTKVHTKAASEMLIRQQLTTLHELAINVMLVKFLEKLADQLISTLMMAGWNTETTELVCAAISNGLESPRYKTSINPLGSLKQQSEKWS